MKVTSYHAKYFAFQLTRQYPPGELEGLIPTLMDAQVDLNPHQIESALFPFSSPLSMGAILADEVGLGKTIEAGIILSQKWAERKRKMLIILPASLRKQWNRELLEKFFLPSTILESKLFKEKEKKGIKNPFSSENKIVICSYQFARNKAKYVMQVKWDLVVFDEAHRLRNVYKKDNKIAKKLRDALKGIPKVLLTATPLQNSLMELYGLTSFVDEHIFGDQESFKIQYSKLDETKYEQLKKRLAPICKRHLRKQVKEYIKYTKRIPITQGFIPEEQEQALYEKVSEYLQRENIQAFSKPGRQLVTMVLRKLLASSTFAMAGALKTTIERCEAILRETPSHDNLDALKEDFESLEDMEDEWGKESYLDYAVEKETLGKEIKELKGFYDLAVSIEDNAKGKALLKALESGFKKAKEIGSSEKVIIFTESKKTQEYVLKKLNEVPIYREKIVLFNGSNTDLKSKSIYEAWKEKNKDSDLITNSKTADMRAALVNYFKNEAQIMIATEAASEGINLQFCSLIVNYDLPWNPQRIEQRIGRCHRYGQKYDVIVINFLNKKNAADKRVFDLLEKKFKLFEGVFGASDEILGVIESGVDFEKRILEIHQKCRTNDEVESAFNQLQKEMSPNIQENMKLAKKKLIENFDEEVTEKLRVNHKFEKDYLDKYQKMLWELSRYSLGKSAQFFEDSYNFYLNERHPFIDEKIPLGPYRMGSNIQNAHVYRLRHPLALKIIEKAKKEKIPFCEITFHYNPPPKITILKDLVNCSGYLVFHRLEIKTLESLEEYLILVGITNKGRILDKEQCERLFSLSAETKEVLGNFGLNDKLLNTQYYEKKEEILKKVETRNSAFFDQQSEKFDLWAYDKELSLKEKLEKFEENIKKLKKEMKKAGTLKEKVSLERKKNNLEKNKDREWKRYEEEKSKIQKERDELVDKIKSQMKQGVTEEVIFKIKWSVIQPHWGKNV